MSSIVPIDIIERHMGMAVAVPHHGVTFSPSNAVLDPSCTDTPADMCNTRVHRHVYRHIHRHVYRHVHRHVFRHVHRHVFRHVYRRVHRHVYRRVERRAHRHVDVGVVVNMLQGATPQPVAVLPTPRLGGHRRRKKAYS